jgi:5-methylcytosine-specific restriction enzyme B
MTGFIQTIYFGPPGCGKSFRVREVSRTVLGIEPHSNRLIETTFHPETGYGDFVSKLLPQSRPHQQEYRVTGDHSSLSGITLKEVQEGVKIEYNVHAGPFIKALALAYSASENVLLVIDEINRGNCALIFGDMFQLLDRDASGWSQYGLDLPDIHQIALEQELNRLGKTLANLDSRLVIPSPSGGKLRIKLKLPPNLSIVGTMNTSDESVYYMDTAFKRRWDFEYMPWNGTETGEAIERQRSAVVEGSDHAWRDFLERLNAHIAERFAGRNVDDKQIGLWFLRSVPEARVVRLAQLRDQLEPLKGKTSLAEWKKVFPNAEKYDKSSNVLVSSIVKDFTSYGVDWPDDAPLAYPEELAEPLIRSLDNVIASTKLLIRRSAILNKLMFFLWDNVFSRDRTPLMDLIGPFDPSRPEPRTFGEFASEAHLARMLEALMTDAAGPAEPASA